MPISQDRSDLLSRFRAGDHAALEEVYWAYVDRVEAIVRNGFAQVDGAAPADIADVVQETFARAFADDTRRRFDGLREYGPFLWSIARHALADWWRRSGHTLPVPDIEALVERTEDAPPTSDTIEAPLAAAVEEYLTGLTPEMAALHRELYVHGRSQREAAAALGISRQSLRTLDKRLCKGLAKALKKRGLEP